MLINQQLACVKEIYCEHIIVKFYAYASYIGFQVQKRKFKGGKYLGRETECDGTDMF
jgi:hypothetical protein